MIDTLNNTSVRFAAIIPVYNRSRTVARAIESVLNQSLPAEEVIVVDDGSTDGSDGIIKSFGDRVTYLHQQNSGASAARNFGVEIASQPWIAFLDSDDYWMPDHLARMESAIRGTDGKAQLYFSNMQRAADEGGVMLWSKCGFEIRGDYKLNSNGADWAMMHRQPMMLQSSVFERQAYVGAGGLNTELKLRHDTHLFLRIGFTNTVCAVNHCGTIMTDDASGVRLTRIHNAGDYGYLKETELLYKDILKSVPTIPSRHARALRYFLSSTTMTLGRLAWREGDKRGAIQYYCKTAMTSRRRIVDGFFRKLVRTKK